MTLPEHDAALQALAHSYRLDTSYHDIWGGERHAPNDAIVSVLKSLGAPLHTLADLSDAHAHRLGTTRSRLLEPVNVAWDGRTGAIGVRLPASLEQARCECILRLED